VIVIGKDRIGNVKEKSRREEEEKIGEFTGEERKKKGR